eukprot:GHVT01082695.1.p1 GENE.GHVT01082695.1~~GHVT01082695.1.p1  ORF type:complete len:462 (-),score=93.76 GHVT01082695.1:1501-2886(-)
MGLRRFVQLRPPGASAARALVKALTAVYVLAARSDCFRSAGRPALLPASARVVTGRVGPVPTTSRDAAWLGSFCYSVGTGQRGTFKAQILVADPRESEGSFVLVEESAEDLKEEGKTDAASLRKYAKVTQAIGSSSGVIPSTPAEGFRTAPLISELDLHVDTKLNGKHVSAWLLGHGSVLEGAYSLEFANPGNWMKRHFACDEASLLPLQLLFLFLYSLGCAWLCLLWRVARAGGGASESMAAATAAAIAFGASAASVALHFFHLLAYALTGVGLFTLLFLGQLCRGLASAMAVAAAVGALSGSGATALGTARSQQPRTSKLFDQLRALSIFFAFCELLLPVVSSQLFYASVGAFVAWRSVWCFPSFVSRLLFTGTVAQAAMAPPTSRHSDRHLVCNSLCALVCSWMLATPLLLLLCDRDVVFDSFFFLAADLAFFVGRSNAQEARGSSLGRKTKKKMYQE